MHFTFLAGGEVVKPLPRLGRMCNRPQCLMLKENPQIDSSEAEGETQLSKGVNLSPSPPSWKQNSLKKIVQWEHCGICAENSSYKTLYLKPKVTFFWAALALHEKANTTTLPDIFFFKFQAFLISNRLLICWFVVLMQLSEVTLAAVLV